MSEGINRVLETLKDAALEADAKAADACMRSKYSIQDYWMCLEFWTQRLHDRIAKEHGLDARCPHGPFRQQLHGFKRAVIENAKAK